MGGDRHACLLTRQHDAELPVYAVHSPGVVPVAQPDMSAVSRVVRVGRRRAGGDMAVSQHAVGDHAGYIVGRHELTVAVAAGIEQGAAEPGYLFGPQLEPDRTEGVPKRAAKPLRVLNAERGEQPWEQEITQVLTRAGVDDAAEQIGARAPGRRRWSRVWRQAAYSGCR